MAKKGKDSRQKKGKETEQKEPSCDLGERVQPAAGSHGFASIAAAIRTNRYLQLLLAITIFGAFLRLFQLGAASVWLDEASTLTFARETVTQIWGSLSTGTEFNPPLFYWMEHGMLAFGDSEAILRLIPAILGILTIPVFYLIGEEILDRNTGIVAAALLAFSPFHLFYSQEARAYGPMLFFYSIAFYFFLRLLKSWGRRDALLFGIFSALAFWTHFYAFVPVLALFLFVIGVKAKSILADLRAAIPLGISIVTFAILSFPLIIFAVQLFLVRTGSAPAFGIQGLATITQTIDQLSGTEAILTWAFTLLFIAGVAALFPRDRQKSILLAFAFVFPLVLSVILSYRMPMVPRYLIYLLAAFFPGIALTIRPACSLVKSRYLVYVALVLVIAINIPHLYLYYTAPIKDDWRGASRELSSLAAPGDLVITLPGYIHQPLNYYYNNETAGTLESGFSRVGDLEAAIAANPGHSAWFVVTGDIMSVDPQGLVVTWLSQHSQLAWEDVNGGVLILKYSG